MIKDEMTNRSKEDAAQRLELFDAWFNSRIDSKSDVVVIDRNDLIDFLEEVISCEL